MKTKVGRNRKGRTQGRNGDESSSSQPSMPAAASSSWLPPSAARRIEEKLLTERRSNTSNVTTAFSDFKSRRSRGGDAESQEEGRQTGGEEEVAGDINVSSNHSINSFDRPGAHHVSGVNATTASYTVDDTTETVTTTTPTTTRPSTATTTAAETSSSQLPVKLNADGTPLLEATLVKDNDDDEEENAQQPDLVRATIASNDDKTCGINWNNKKIRIGICCTLFILLLLIGLLGMSLRGEITGDRDDNTNNNNGTLDDGGAETASTTEATSSPSPTMSPTLSKLFQRKVTLKELLPSEIYSEFEEELISLNCTEVDYGLRSEDCSSLDAVAISTVKIIKDHVGTSFDDVYVDFIAILLGTKTIGIFYYDKRGVGVVINVESSEEVEVQEELRWLHNVQLLNLDEVLRHEQNLALYCTQQQNSTRQEEPQQQQDPPSNLSFVCTVAVAYKHHAAVYQVSDISVDGNSDVSNWIQLGSDFVEFSTTEGGYWRIEGYISVQLDGGDTSNDNIVLAVAAANYTSGKSWTSVYEYMVNNNVPTEEVGWKLMGNKSIPGFLDFTESPVIIDLARGGKLIAIGIMGFSGSGLIRTYEYNDFGSGCLDDNSGLVISNHSWCQIGDEIAGGDYEDSFAASLSITPNGDTLVVGAPGTYDCETGPFCSIVRAYSYASGGTVPVWLARGQTMMVRNETNNNSQQQLGGLGGNVAISADGHKVAMTRYGFSQDYDKHVYVFTFHDGIWQQEFEYKWGFDNSFEEASTAMAFSSRPPYSLVTSIGGNVTILY